MEVAITREHREAGVFGKTRIGEGKIAEDKDRAARGFEPAGVEAIGAEPICNAVIRRIFFLVHKSSITHEVPVKGVQTIPH
jgi:hypothetical protein